MIIFKESSIAFVIYIYQMKSLYALSFELWLWCMCLFCSTVVWIENASKVWIILLRIALPRKKIELYCPTSGHCTVGIGKVYFLLSNNMKKIPRRYHLYALNVWFLELFHAIAMKITSFGIELFESRLVYRALRSKNSHKFQITIPRRV